MEPEDRSYASAAKPVSLTISLGPEALRKIDDALSSYFAAMTALSRIIKFSQGLAQGKNRRVLQSSHDEDKYQSVLLSFGQIQGF
jgi:hypothetical protein